MGEAHREPHVRLSVQRRVDLYLIVLGGVAAVLARPARDEDRER